MGYRPQYCTNRACEFNQKAGGQFVKNGSFYTKRLNQHFRRFRCLHCKKSFSSRSIKLDWRHKKMDLNFQLAKLLVEGSSLRGAARILGLTYYNTYKKFLWLKRIVEAKKKIIKYEGKILQFDELETIHHTKCKPLSVALVVNEEYQLLAAQVAEIPAKGRLAEISRKKYGMRKNESTQKLKEAFGFVTKRVSVDKVVLLQSDQKPGYLEQVRGYFPGVNYQQFNQAEKERRRDRLHEKYQKKRFDPLFAINHKCALLRSHVKRLTRRSWCTTKKPENLQLHLDLFIIMQFVERF